jgi:hypothetical protein
MRFVKEPCQPRRLAGHLVLSPRYPILVSWRFESLLGLSSLCVIQNTLQTRLIGFESRVHGVLVVAKVGAVPGDDVDVYVRYGLTGLGTVLFVSYSWMTDCRAMG